MLTAFHHAVLVRIPAARIPAKLQRAPHSRPQPPQPVVVALELPVAVHSHDAAHLPVSRSNRPAAGLLQRQMHAKAHAAVFTRGVKKLNLAHAGGQFTKEEGSGLFVVPDVSAGTKAAAGVIVTTFPAKGVAIRRAECRLRAQRTHVIKRAFLNDVRHITGQETVDEQEGVTFQLRQVGGAVLGRLPGVGEARSVVVANHNAVGRLGFGLMPAVRPGQAVGEMPAQQEGDGLAASRRDRHTGGQRANWRLLVSEVAVFQPPVVAEVIPEIQQ